MLFTKLQNNLLAPHAQWQWRDNLTSTTIVEFYFYIMEFIKGEVHFIKKIQKYKKKTFADNLLTLVIQDMSFFLQSKRN